MLAMIIDIFCHSDNPQIAWTELGRRRGRREQAHPSRQSGIIGSGRQRIADDFLERIQAFHDKNARWPRTWGDFRFSDLGLDPAPWAVPVEGVYWNPHGSEIGLANKAGDNLQIYVKDFRGNWLHLYDGWNIWCRAEGCYFHTVAPGNEVDISTLTVKQP